MRAFFAIMCGVMLLVPAVRADAPCYGRGDMNGDGMVTGEDLDPYSCCMGGPDVTTPPPGCDPDLFAQGDLDADGDIDLHDVAELAILVGQSYFPYGPNRDNLEAELLAMDMSYRLRAPDAEYYRILGDLALIRAAYPALETVIDDMDYAPNRLIVSLDEHQPLDEYYALNEYYLAENEEIHSFYRILTFCEHLNAPVLETIYAELPAVTWAQPDYLYGSDDQITVVRMITGEFRYSIDDGFWDCIDGCDCHRYWVLDVDQSGTVTLVSYNEAGEYWCDFTGGE